MTSWIWVRGRERGVGGCLIFDVCVDEWCYADWWRREGGAGRLVGGSRGCRRGAEGTGRLGRSAGSAGGVLALAFRHCSPRVLSHVGLAAVAYINSSHALCAPAAAEGAGMSPLSLEDDVSAVPRPACGAPCMLPGRPTVLRPLCKPPGSLPPPACVPTACRAHPPSAPAATGERVGVLCRGVAQSGRAALQ